MATPKHSPSDPIAPSTKRVRVGNSAAVPDATLSVGSFMPPVVVPISLLHQRVPPVGSSLPSLSSMLLVRERSLLAQSIVAAPPAVSFVQQPFTPSPAAMGMHSLLHPLASSITTMGTGGAAASLGVLHEAQLNSHITGVNNLSTSFMGLAQVHLNNFASMTQSQLQPQIMLCPPPRLTPAPSSDVTSPSDKQVLTTKTTPPQQLPICQEALPEHESLRHVFPFAINEDVNWLTEFQCFVRSELVEVFRASHSDVGSRRSKVLFQQVGLRCRFCAHKPANERTGRSCAFPSSKAQIYQSFTMMVRDHFTACPEIPSDKQDTFAALRGNPTQGANDSKQFWIYASMKMGMRDTPNGIFITEESLAERAQVRPFRTDASCPPSDDDGLHLHSRELVTADDCPSEFHFLLLSQLQIVHLVATECTGTRRKQKVGTPGLGCRFCRQAQLFGCCRAFPPRKRALPEKLEELYKHILRCRLCPNEIKEELQKAKQLDSCDETRFQSMYALLWARMGNSSAPNIDDQECV